MDNKKIESGKQLFDDLEKAFNRLGKHIEVAGLRKELDNIKLYLSKGEDVRQNLHKYLTEELGVIPVETNLDEIIHITNPYMFKVRSELFTADQKVGRLVKALEWYADSKNYIASETVINKSFAERIEDKAKYALKDIKP